MIDERTLQCRRGKKCANTAFNTCTFANFHKLPETKSMWKTKKKKCELVWFNSSMHTRRCRNVSSIWIWQRANDVCIVISNLILMRIQGTINILCFVIFMNERKKKDKILSYAKVATIIWLKYNRFSHTYFSYYPTCFTNNIFFDVGDAGLRDTVVLKTRYVLFSGRLTISSHIIFSDLTIKAADISTSTHRNNMGLHAVLAAEIARCAYSHGSNTSNLYWEYSPTVCHICTIAKESQMRTGIK